MSTASPGGGRLWRGLVTGGGVLPSSGSCASATGRGYGSAALRLLLCGLLGRRRPLGRGLLLCRLLGGRLLLRRPLLHRRLLAALDEELGRPLQGDVLDGVTLAQRRIGRAVGDVGAET